MDFIKAASISEDIKQAEEVIRIYNKIKENLKLELKSICTHPESTTVHTVEYISGDYYNKSYSIHTYTCTICGSYTTHNNCKGGHYG